jgi:Endonuclease NucS C-terminal domain
VPVTGSGAMYRCLTDGVLYDRPVRELLADAVAQLEHPSRPGDYVDWFARHYPAVKDNTVRMHITAYTANDRNRQNHANARRRPALLFKRSDDRLEPYDEARHGTFDEFGEPRESSQPAAQPEFGSDPAADAPAGEAAMEFLLENYLEDFLASNWPRIDWGRPLEIYDGGTGHQFSTPVGRLDFLCRDVSTGALVAVELKRGRPTDQVVGQLARYMGWLRQHFAAPGQSVEGIIVAHDIDPKLQYAATAVPGTTVMAYEITFRLIDNTLALPARPTPQPPWPPPSASA